MTEETKQSEELVNCELFKVSLDRKNMIKYNLPGHEENFYVSPNAILDMIDKTNLKDLVLKGIALNADLFTQVVNIRRAALEEIQKAEALTKKEG